MFIDIEKLFYKLKSHLTLVSSRMDLTKEDLDAIVSNFKSRWDEIKYLEKKEKAQISSEDIAACDYFFAIQLCINPPNKQFKVLDNYDNIFSKFYLTERGQSVPVIAVAILSEFVEFQNLDVYNVRNQFNEWKEAISKENNSVVEYNIGLDFNLTKEEKRNVINGLKQFCSAQEFTNLSNIFTTKQKQKVRLNCETRQIVEFLKRLRAHGKLKVESSLNSTIADWIKDRFLVNKLGIYGYYEIDLDYAISVLKNTNKEPPPEKRILTNLYPYKSRLIIKSKS